MKQFSCATKLSKIVFLCSALAKWSRMIFLRAFCIARAKLGRSSRRYHARAHIKISISEVAQRMLHFRQRFCAENRSCLLSSTYKCKMLKTSNSDCWYLKLSQFAKRSPKVFAF